MIEYKGGQLVKGDLVWDGFAWVKSSGMGESLPYWLATLYHIPRAYFGDEMHQRSMIVYSRDDYLDYMANHENIKVAACNVGLYEPTKLSVTSVSIRHDNYFWDGVAWVDFPVKLDAVIDHLKRIIGVNADYTITMDWPRTKDEVFDGLDLPPDIIAELCKRNGYKYYSSGIYVHDLDGKFACYVGELQ